MAIREPSYPVSVTENLCHRKAGVPVPEESVTHANLRAGFERVRRRGVLGRRREALLLVLGQAAPSCARASGRGRSTARGLGRRPRIGAPAGALHLSAGRAPELRPIAAPVGGSECPCQGGQSDSAHQQPAHGEVIGKRRGLLEGGSVVGGWSCRAIVDLEPRARTRPEDFVRVATEGTASPRLHAGSACPGKGPRTASTK